MKRSLFHILGCAVLALGFFSALPAQAQTNVGTYADLQTACAAAGAGNVTLTADILDGTTQLTIERDLTLDLNGHSLTIDLDAPTGQTSNGIKIDSGVTLTLMDSSPGANALTVTNGADDYNRPAVGSNFGAGINSSEGTLVIDSGTVNANGGYTGAGIGGGRGADGGIITIDGGMVTVNGGVDAAGIGGGSRGDGGTITINGGTVNANSSSFGAGIGGGSLSDGGIIEINGGTVDASGGYGAGIGGGGGFGGSGGDGGTITITSGTVKATGRYSGAGIGGGDSNGSSGTIIITGDAVVTARSGSYTAGIGSNNAGSIDSILIDTTGTVTATGGTASGGAGRGAAIGRGGQSGGVNGAGIGNVTHPAAASVTTPATATFNARVAAVGTTPPTLAYQWEVFTGGAFANVTSGTGGTTTGYTTAATTLAMSGNQYRNVITATNVNGDGTGTITYVTHPATLTVNAATAINTASIDVTAPATGAAPNATVTACGNGTDFTCGTVTWAPNDNPFQAGTQYTATITLTANAGYTFTGLAAATINGNAANVIGNTGNTVTLSYQFTATGAPPTVRANLASIPVLNPAMLALLALALGGLAFRQRRRSA